MRNRNLSPSPPLRKGRRTTVWRVYQHLTPAGRRRLERLLDSWARRAAPPTPEGLDAAA